ncbi:MAG: flagellar brake protein [Gammaproteobacteria bacterium]|nr:flagellar brake protein [Gammaproteobacteria bacterium]
MPATHTPEILAEQAVDKGVTRVERVTHGARIAGLVLRLHQKRALLSVGVPGVAERYNSTLLSVRPDNNSMLLDELIPRQGHAHLIQQRALHVQGQLRGVEIDFSSVLLEAGSKDGMAYYRVALPGTLNYAQRRSHYRARIGAGSQIRVTFMTAWGETLSGQLSDIAVGGLGARCNFPDTALNHGDLIPRCVIRFAPHDEISSAVEVRSVSREIQSGQWRVGVRFLDLDMATEARIARFVASLDREMRKQDRQRK